LAILLTVASNPLVEKAFDFAQETTKQLLALAVGILTITVTFQGNLTKNHPHANHWPAQAAWVSYGVSILFGGWTLMALSGSLEKPPNNKLSIYSDNIRWPSALQVLSFVAGVGFSVLFGWRAISA
jgi:hypothetical protein